jgi:hypothetical protein
MTEEIDEGLAALKQKADDVYEQARAEHGPGDDDQQTPEPPPAEEAKTEDWQHKYSVLQGKYNAEVPRLAEDNRYLRGQVDVLAEQVQQLLRQVQQPAPSAQEDVTKALTERFGWSDDDVKAMDQYIAKRAKNVVDPELNPVKQRMEQMADQNQLTTAQQFWNTVTARYPEYEQMRTDPEVIAWADQYDPVAGMTRAQALNQALGQADAKRYVEILNGYTAAKPAPAPESTSKTADTRLQAKVTPRRAGGSSGRETPETMSLAEFKRLSSQAQIAQTEGRYDEAKRLNAKINAAIAERRVAPS